MVRIVQLLVVHLLALRYEQVFIILSFYSRSPGGEKDDAHVSNSAPEIRDVFGDSDDEEPAEYTVQNNVGEDPNVRFRCQKNNA